MSEFTAFQHTGCEFERYNMGCYYDDGDRGNLRIITGLRLRRR